MQASPLAVVAAAVLLGVAGQILASLTRLPAIVYLLLLGIVAGPFGIGVIDPGHLGGSLPVLVSAFVAIILFEGALTLRPNVLGQAMVPVRRLITVGAVLTYLGAGILAWFLIGLPWSLAFLFASLVIVTGPTVIAPILRRVRLTPRLHAVIKSESILIDPVGVFVAVATFQYVVGLATNEVSWRGTLEGFLIRVGIGSVVGGVAGFAAAGLMRLNLFHRRGNEHLVNLGALGLALSVFAIAEQLQHESGIMAVIVAGLILATLPIPFRSELEVFKEHVTTLGVSVLFILLSANLNLQLLARIGWGEVLLLVGLILLVRPASVFLATAGTELTVREKTFVSLIAPRGILAAAMSSYFAEQLRERGLPGADRIELLVFFTIAVTVCLQGGWAAWLARLLRVQPVPPEGVVLIGINEWSLLLAEELRKRGRRVLLLDTNAANCETARERGLEVQLGDATNEDTYAALDLATYGVLLAMTSNDAVNALACGAAMEHLGEHHVMQIVSKPSGTELRPGLRLRGAWAMPSARPHREILQLLRDRQLVLTQEMVTRAMAIAPDIPTSHGPMIPLLVLNHGHIGIAVSGQPCSPNSILIGLVASEAATGPEDSAPDLTLRVPPVLEGEGLRHAS